MSKVRVGIVGAGGYVGIELVRLLKAHEGVAITYLGGRNEKAQRLSELAPAFVSQLDGDALPEVERYDADAVKKRCEVVFCALPHGQSGAVVKELLERQLIVIDLSADFRLRDAHVAERWYGPSQAPEWIGKAVYGLPELYRSQLRSTNLIAAPGCHATVAILATAPLVAHDLVDRNTIVIDSKTGVSGAGKTPTQTSHYVHVEGGIRAYKTAGAHRHIAEIEQTLSDVSGEPVRVTFTPQLVPMSRGILITAYAKLRDVQMSAEHLHKLMSEFYAQAAFVKVLPPGAHPDTSWVRGCNFCHVSHNIDPRTHFVIVQATIDNLVKGAAGQAVQCMNLRMGFAESMGLTAMGLFL